MNRIKKIIVCIIIVLSCLSVNIKVNAYIDDKNIKIVEYDNEYKEWLELSDEEKDKAIEPIKYIPSDSTPVKNNPFFKNQLLRSSLNSKFSLNELISENCKVRNQETTNMCWAFASIGALETALGMQDYKNNNLQIVYDFSERHMAYSCSRNAFLDNKINKQGYNVTLNQGGNFLYAQNYLTSGKGAISEEQMPFKNTETNIDISELENKDVLTTVYDTTIFTSNLSDEKEKMKEFISTYGGLVANIYGASASESEYYNPETSALYVNDEAIKANHAILIVGWDDNFDKNNFINKPQNNGAWIIKNSWGESIEISLDDAKKQIFEDCKDELIKQEIYSYEDLADEGVITLLEQNGYIFDRNKNVFIEQIGENGYMYVSYEDLLINENVYGIKKANYQKDFTKVYLNDELGITDMLDLPSEYLANKQYIANEFKRDINSEETIDKISLSAFETMDNCKVYINPCGNDKSKGSLQEVELKYGNSSNNTIDIQPGYHMIEFATPIKLTGDSFVIVVEVDSRINCLCIENKGLADIVDIYKYIEVNDNESFFTCGDSFYANEWLDLNKGNGVKGNFPIRAYTNESYKTSTLKEISITKQPNKIDYIVGESFDETGMQVTAIYEDGTRNIVDNYSVEDGTNLQLGKSGVMIKYIENNILCTTTQLITVSADNANNISNMPKASNFSNAKANVTKTNFSYGSLVEENFEFSTDVSGIIRGDEVSNYKYYYAIMPTRTIADCKNEYYNLISDEKVTKQNDGTYKIVIDIKVSDLKNISELEKADNLYLYVKEVANKNSNSIETVNIMDFIDLKEEKQNGVVNLKNNSGLVVNGNNDNTVSNNKLPKAGKLNIFIGCLIIVLISVFSYYQYKNIDR